MSRLKNSEKQILDDVIMFMHKIATNPTFLNTKMGDKILQAELIISRLCVDSSKLTDLLRDYRELQEAFKNYGKRRESQSFVEYIDSKNRMR